MAAAGGIMVSLLTTVLGLIVGIPAFIAFNYFTSVINRFVLDVRGIGSRADRSGHVPTGPGKASRNDESASERHEREPASR